MGRLVLLLLIQFCLILATQATHAPDCMQSDGQAVIHDFFGRGLIVVVLQEWGSTPVLMDSCSKVVKTGVGVVVVVVV